MYKPSDDIVSNLARLAREDKEYLKRKGIHSPDVSKYKYKVTIGTATHYTNSKQRYKELMENKKTYEEQGFAVLIKQQMK